VRARARTPTIAASSSGKNPLGLQQKVYPPVGMTPEELLAEGRAIQRACVFLTTKPSGSIAGVWYPYSRAEIEAQGERCWLSVDASTIPGVHDALSGFISVVTDERSCEGGRVDVTTHMPTRDGVALYAYAANVLPPIDAVFARGSARVEASRSKTPSRGSKRGLRRAVSSASFSASRESARAREGVGAQRALRVARAAFAPRRERAAVHSRAVVEKQHVS
jgi:hypothetical protein